MQTSQQVSTASRDARFAAAQQALATAEARAGLRQRLTGATTLTAPPEAGRGTPSSAVPDELVLPVPLGLEGLFPAGGLRRGSAVRVSGSTSLLLALAAAAAGGGTWCAVVAMPDAGLAAAAEVGLDLDRTLVVPRPGPDAPAVLGALIDGFDVVVLGRCPALSDADRRAATSRLRTREAVLLTSETWAGAQVVLEVGERSWFGVGSGDGVLAGREATVTSGARGWGARRSVRVRMPAHGGVEMVPGLSAPGTPELDWARAG